MRLTLRLAVVILIGIAAARPLSSDGFADRIFRFHQHWNQFFRVYLGCPEHATDAEQCDPSRGRLDYGIFLKAAKEARPLFALEQK